jgi:uncharacterized GH25 family protein
MFNKNLFKLLFLALSATSVVSFSTASTAHEFWLEPLSFKVEQGAKVQAHIKVGQGLNGDTYAFYPTNFERFDLTDNKETSPLLYRFAQKPAVDQPTSEDGLHVLTYQSRPTKLVYENPDKFKSFLKAEGIEWVLAEHEKRGLPLTDINELFKRFAKTLVKVGSGEGEDRLMGMPFEFVVLDNPYTDASIKTVTAQLFFESNPFANSHVNVFIKRDDEIKQVELKTDTEGKVEVSVVDGGLFLINAVHMVIPDASVEKSEGVPWMSLWASTTFEVD